MTSYLFFVLVWIDQGINTVLGPFLNWAFDPLHSQRFGNPDETLSSVFGKNEGVNDRCETGRLLINALFFWQEDHCRQSIEYLSGQKRPSSQEV